MIDVDDNGLECASAILFTAGAMMGCGVRSAINVVRVIRRDGQLVDIGCETAADVLQLLSELQPDLLEIVCGDEQERGAWRALSSRAEAVLH
jgi:hypothetical protein